jgi:hypothetical protein
MAIRNSVIQISFLSLLIHNRWAVQRYYPAPNQEGVWWNRGNHWTLMKDEPVLGIGPGKRYKHAMIIDYEMVSSFFIIRVLDNNLSLWRNCV